MNERWGKYLASREWALLKRAVKKRAGNKCERCLVAALDQVHHLTYIRAYCEQLDDLQGLCGPCHEFISAVTDIDPAAKAIPAVAVPSFVYPPLAIHNTKNVWAQLLSFLGPRDAAFLERGELAVHYSEQGISAQITFRRCERAAYEMSSRKESKIAILEAMTRTSIAPHLIDVSMQIREDFY